MGVDISCQFGKMVLVERETYTQTKGDLYEISKSESL